MKAVNSGFYIKEIFKRDLKNIIISKEGSLVANLEVRSIVNFLSFLKLHTNAQHKHLLDVYGVDYPTRKQRFEVNYMSLSMIYNSRILTKINIYQDQIVDSVMSIYNSANWLEREVWDMFGVFFNNHKDLRRILTDYGFEGFPLRKDFPLTGYLQFRYDEESQTVISEPIELTQEFRSFECNMPWAENR